MLKNLTSFFHYKNLVSMFWYALPPMVMVTLYIYIAHKYNALIGFAGFDGQENRFIANVGLLVFIFGWALLIRSRMWRYIYLGIVSAILSLVAVSHFIYTSYAGGYLSVSSLKYLWQLPTVQGSVAELAGPELLFFISPLLAILIMGVTYRMDKASKITRKTSAVLLSVALLVSFSGTSITFAREIKKSGSAYQLINHPFNSDELVKKVGIFNYTIYDGVKYIFKKKYLTEAEISYINQEKKKVQFSGKGNASKGVLENFNIIYIQLESFQQFLINKTVAGQPITPNLNRLANNGVSFTDFHYVTGPGTSSDAEFTALNSLYNLGDLAVFFDYPYNKYEALPKVLRGYGYSTVAMHGDSRNFWNRSNAYPSLGYDQFFDINTYKITESVGWGGVSDEDFFQQSVEKLNRIKQPYFAHLITMTSHTPFVIDKKYHQLDLGSVGLNETQKNYLHSVKYTDNALGKFVTQLEKSGKLKNTALVIVGDHEAHIAEADDLEYAKFLGYEKGFNGSTFANSKSVPFILYAPGTINVQSKATPSSHMDIYPTLLNLLGLQIPKNVLGNDLFNTGSPIVVRRKRSAGVSIEFAKNGRQTYTNFADSDFKKGLCYTDGVKVEVTECEALYGEAVLKMTISDLVITGNRLDLLQ